jgi:hypothetical protein
MEMESTFGRAARDGVSYSCNLIARETSEPSPAFGIPSATSSDELSVKVAGSARREGLKDNCARAVGAAFFTLRRR